MSLRRTVEENFKNRLSVALANTKYKVVGGVEREDRPASTVIVMGGEGTTAVPELNMPYGNYTCDLSVIIMSPIDIESVAEHNDVADIVDKCMQQRDTKKVAVVEKLHLYDTQKISIGEANDNEGRKVGTVYNYKVVLNYTP